MDMRTEAIPRREQHGASSQAPSSAQHGSRKLSRWQRLPTLEWAESLAANGTAAGAGVGAARRRQRQRSRTPFLIQIGANDHSQDADGGDVAPQLLASRSSGGGGWRGVLVEPMPATYERLHAKYAHRSPRVRCVQAISAAQCKARPLGSVGFWGIETSNSTGLWGSAHADARCALGDPDAGWLTELSSLSAGHVRYQIHAVDKPPLSHRVCARCATKLQRPSLGHHCLRDIGDALRKVNVPCVDWSSLLLRGGERTDNSHDRPTVHLLLIDAEGHDDEVISHYPFASIETWRVVFEAARMHRSRHSLAAAILRANGFRHVSGGFGAMQSVWHHVNSSEAAWAGEVGGVMG